MTRITRQLLTGGFLLAASGVLQAAPIYNYTSTSPGQNPAGGKLSAIDTTYDSNTQQFSWAYTVEDPNNGTHNGFWLVVNNGPDNPKGEDMNLAILYGDLVNRDVTAYVYNGKNNPGSYGDQGGFLASFDDVLDVSDYSGGNGTGTRDVAFSIDVGDINSRINVPSLPTWEGIAFDDKLGIWFHSTTGSGAAATYDDHGLITSFTTGATGWVDTSALETKRVPEPGMLSLAGMGLIAFGAARRRSRRKS